MDIPPRTSALPPEVLDAAADWLVRLHAGDTTDAEREAARRWREQDPLHAQAWQRAERFLALFDSVPADIGKPALSRRRQTERRAALKALLLLGSLPPAWLAARELPWPAWQADLRTATGERRPLQLADGTHLVLNTDSAVDVAFGAAERLLHLHRGEILITTAPDPQTPPRPLRVATPHGRIRAIGTRFSVRRHDAFTQVAVFDGAVELTPLHGAARLLSAGQQARFDIATTHPPASVDATAASWVDGMLIAKQMHLPDLLAELARYRPGVLRCDPALAALRVSGAFPLDTERSLRLLADTQPVRIQRLTRYWVNVEAAPAH